jgi:hypothetical protein
MIWDLLGFLGREVFVNESAQLLHREAFGVVGRPDSESVAGTTEK